MTTTYTYTATRTYTRIELLKTQVRIALRRTTNISPETLASTFDKGLNKHLISKALIYAVDNQNRCKAQLILEIDWDEYNLQISRGRITVVVDSNKWKDDTAIELDEVISLFNRYVATYSLTTKWQVYKAGNLSYESWLKELGLVKGDDIKWERGWSSPIPELPELRVGCYLAED